LHTVTFETRRDTHSRVAALNCALSDSAMTNVPTMRLEREDYAGCCCWSSYASTEQIWLAANGANGWSMEPQPTDGWPSVF